MLPTRYLAPAVLIAVFLFAVVGSGSARAQDVSSESQTAGATDTTTTPVVERIRSFISEFNRLSPEDWDQGERLVQTHYADSTFDTDVLHDRIRFFLRDRDLSSGYTIRSVDVSSPSRATALVQEKFWGGHWRILFEVQPEGAHRIINLDYQLPPDTVGSASKRPSITQTEMVRKARKILQEGFEVGKVAGNFLIGRNGHPLLAEAYGPANRTYGVDNRLETKFSLASLSKMFTAVAIAQLVSEGKVDLDDKLAEYAPNLPTSKAARKIEIRHLLSHSSGMGDFLEEARENPNKAPIELIRGDTLRFEPGTDASYSNSGFIALGEVIEIAADTSYADYLQENVFGPTGMNNTGIDPPGNVLPHAATGYEKKYTENGTRYHRTGILGSDGSAAGGGYSTVLDLLRFATALQDGTLADPEVLRQFITSKPELGQAGYGYGFTVKDDGNIYGHNGGFPGVDTGLEIYRDSGFVVVVLSNRSGAWIRRRVSNAMRELIHRVR
jgi:CubicO group peptidase (beta-lactamase class C family)